MLKVKNREDMIKYMKKSFKSGTYHSPLVSILRKLDDCTEERVFENIFFTKKHKGKRHDSEKKSYYLTFGYYPRDKRQGFPTLSLTMDEDYFHIA